MSLQPDIAYGNYGISRSQLCLPSLDNFVAIVAGFSMDPFWRRNYLHLVRNRSKAIGENDSGELEHRLPLTIAGSNLDSL
jgi:hypothetical protein